MTERRQQILRAAAEIVAESGVAGLSVRAVATRAGIGASTLRHYFPTQRDLYDAVVGQSFHAQLEDLRINDRTIPPAQRLAECLGQFLPRDDGQTIELEAWLTAHAAAVGPARTEQAATLLASMTQHARERVDGWLATIESEGALGHPDRQRCATLLLALIDGLCLDLLTPGTHTTVALAHDILTGTIDSLVIRQGVGASLSGGISKQ